MTTAKVKRSQFRTFIDVDPGYQDWALIGDGVTAAEIAYNPETSEETYIHQDSGSAEIEGYKPNMPIEASAINGDDVFEFVDGLRKSRAILDAAHTQVVNVWLYEDDTDGAYPAELQDVAVSIDSFGGDGGASAKINYTILYRGDPTMGTFNPTTLAFVPAS
jgi:hypothetical protein